MDDDNGYSGGWGGTEGVPALPPLPPVKAPTDWSWVGPVTGGLARLLGLEETPAPAAPPQVIIQPSAIPTWVPWVVGGGIGLYLLTDRGRRRR